MSTNTQSVTPTHTSVPPQHAAESQSGRRRENAPGPAWKQQERENEAGEGGGGEGSRRSRHEGGSLVNVSPVSPGPQRRAADRRTMATGSIQEHGSCERAPGSVCCSAGACKDGREHTLSHTLGELRTTGISRIAAQ